jgi:hypothetical protein
LTTAITLALHDNLVGVVGEAVQRALSQDGIVEERDPLLDGPVGGNDGGASPVTLDDDLVEVAGLLGIEAAEPKVIDDEEVRGEEASEHALGGVIGPGLMDELEERIAPEEEHPVSGPAGAVSKGTGKERLSNAYRPKEEDILVAIEEAEAEEVTDPVPVEGDGCVPIEVLERVVFLEPGPVEAGGEVLVIPAVDLVLEGEFEEVEGTEGGFLGVGGPIRKGRGHSEELQALEHRFQGSFDFIHDPSSWLGGE